MAWTEKGSLAGPKGDTGPRGDTGPAGATGPKGETGDAASVAQQSVSLTPNTALANYSAYTDSSYRIGKFVVLQCAIVLSRATTFGSAELRLFTLPSGSRPAAQREMLRMCQVITGDGEGVVLRGVRVKTDGSVCFVNGPDGTAGATSIIIPGVAFAT